MKKMNDLDPNLKKEFVEETIKEYISSLRVTEYLKNVPVDEEHAGEEFKQIGLRTKVEADVFSPHTGKVYVSPHVIGLGRAVAIGENDYFIVGIIEDPKISREQLKKSDFTPDKLIETIADMRARIFLPVRLKFELFRDKKWRGRLNFNERTLKFDTYPVFSVSDKVINNKIIILDELAAIWKYVLFENKITGGKERLDINIGDTVDGKVDVIVRSMGNLRIHHKNYCKILQLI
jgi:hypothetical protein